LEGEILEKPQNAQHAESMLLSLSGKQHLVYTGVCLLFPEGTELVPNGLSKLHTFSEETLVTFSTLSSEMIASYVASGIPLDKSGAYGIQDQGGSFVEHIKGCYYNVILEALFQFSFR